jgi:hypothetical protein
MTKKEAKHRYYEKKVKPFRKTKKPATKKLRFTCPMCGMLVNLQKFEGKHRIKLVWNYYLGYKGIRFEEIREPKQLQQLTELMIQRAMQILEELGFEIKPPVMIEQKVAPKVSYEGRTTPAIYVTKIPTYAGNIELKQKPFIEVNTNVEVENG